MIATLVVLAAVATPMPSAYALAPAASISSAVPAPNTVPVALSCGGGLSRALEPTDYYAIDLVPTGRVPGTRLAQGVAYQTAAVSPFFGVSLAPGGEYTHDLDIQIEGLKPLQTGAWVAWVTDTEVEQIVRIGALDDGLRVRGQTQWNKFLVVITREPGAAPTAAWEGPVIMRGISRSGRMHTLAGHGPFQAEPCAKYGFR